MEKQTRQIVITALLLMIVGIILGAFGAHGLEDKVSAEKIASYEVGVRYQMLNSLGLLILAALKPQFSFSLKPTFVCILIGIVLFSGSIYGLTFQEKGSSVAKILGPITPIGGLLMIIGWTITLLKVICMPKANG